MANEQIVCEIRDGYSVTDYMQLLYENNLPLIKKFIKPFAAYEPMEIYCRKPVQIAVCFMNSLAVIKYPYILEHCWFSLFSGPEMNRRQQSWREKLIGVMNENEQLKAENSKLRETLNKVYDFMKPFVADGRNLLERFLESMGQVVIAQIKIYK